MTGAGVQHGSTTTFSAGVVTRGVLLDLAPGSRLPGAHPVTGADLDAAERRGGSPCSPATPWWSAAGGPSRGTPWGPTPGLTLDAVTWLHRKDVALYAGDVGDAVPPLDPHLPMPLHMVGLARRGLPLVDGAQVEELVAVRAELGRSTFLLSLAPFRLRGATGVPVNPLAIF